MTHSSADGSSEPEAADGVPADSMSASIADIVTFNDVKDPNLWVRPTAPSATIEIVDHDPAWADNFAEAGFVLTIREPAWYEHRMLKRLDPEPGQLGCNLHVFGPRCAEVARMRLFRDWLREHEDEREAYQSTKRTSAEESNAAGETVLGYNARKQDVVREIYHRIFEARGWV
ncbi:GrpB protein [Brevibacterium siliguriense]|uniref:GrpB protein n=1 Tax=Brevibacterium siliguriense TaxID=1136497 RepID=A0A1H1PBY0_9MICO|nr:GrpB family protein [Brevibacterium siliguriense]SDS08761.1 GrpB protein [Brevibacterium siliguriense]